MIQGTVNDPYIVSYSSNTVVTVLDEHLTCPNANRLRPWTRRCGSRGSEGALREADIALDIALRIKRHLLQNDFKVVMTREDDSTVALLKRTKIANESKADVFISNSRECR